MLDQDKRSSLFCRSVDYEGERILAWDKRSSLPRPVGTEKFYRIGGAFKVDSNECMAPRIKLWIEAIKGYMSKAIQSKL